MNYQTAHNLLITQGIDADRTGDSLLRALSQGVPPVPGQVTAVLLALKVVFESVQTQTSLERELAASLHILASESRRYFAEGQRFGVEWPPLLADDLARIALAVKSIFLGQWFEFRP